MQIQGERIKQALQEKRDQIVPIEDIIEENKSLTLEEALELQKEKILEINRNQLEKEYPEYFYCKYILQIPLGCTLLFGDVSFFFLVLIIVVSSTIIVFVFRKRK